MSRCKRIRKKKHKEYIAEVVFDISTSSEWREKLDAAEPMKAFHIRSNELKKADCWDLAYIKRYKLDFTVYKKTFEEDPTGKKCLFIFYATDFPSIIHSSYNNLEYL